MIEEINRTESGGTAAAAGMSQAAPTLPSPLVLARKELYSFFISPAVYGITLFFLLFTAIWNFYFQSFYTRDIASLRMYFGGVPLAFILVIPALTMKSWAEERKMGSYEWLVTMPFSEWGLVLGKFLAAFGVLVIILVLTLPVPLTLARLGSFDTGIIVCEYLGALLLGAAATAIGLFMSVLSKNQAAAFLASAAVLLVIMFINQIPMVATVPPPLAAFISFISLNYHFESFARGLLDSRDLAYFILTCLVFLFLNAQVILYRKWS
jgi:ABC-2 type transport system permease protein